MREGAKEGSCQLLGKMEDTSPQPSPPGAPANRPDLRARGAQDAKHAAKLLDVILPGEKWGPIQQLPQDAAHGPADTKPKQLTDYTWTGISHTGSITPHWGPRSPHISSHLTLGSRHPQSSLEAS